jgi:K+-transporting ATPase ATPase C chain
MELRAQLRLSLILLGLLTLLTGVAYPLFVTAIAQLLFPFQANGSLIHAGRRVVGSALIGQPFDHPRYFWGRPSATGRAPYDAAASSGSNLGPLSDALLDAVKARVDALRVADPGNPAPVPVDLVTASSSGLDPDVSLAAAYYQVPRIARARGLDPGAVRGLIAQLAEGRQLGILGEPRVNVLALNLALDAGGGAGRRRHRGEGAARD